MLMVLLSSMDAHDEIERRGAIGLDWTEIPDQLPLRDQPKFTDVNRLVDPKQAMAVLDFPKSFSEFTVEEQLQFAIAHKQFPKNFLRIGQEMPGKTRQECMRHYYRYKHDGRFETETLEERPKKNMEKLPPSDRRRPENIDTNGLGVIRAQIGRSDITQAIPLDLEIERLFAFLPAAQHATYRQRLAVATRAHADRVAAAEKAAREAELEEQREAKRERARAKKARAKANKSRGTIQQVAKEPEVQAAVQPQKTLDANALFSRLHQSLENMRQGLAALLAGYEEAATMLSKAEEDQRLQDTYETHRQRVLLIGNMLRALFDGTEEMDRKFDKEFAHLDQQELVVQLALCLISAKTGIVQLKLDKERLDAKIAAFPKKATRRGGAETPVELQAMQEERELQLVQLKSLAEKLLELMEDELKEAEDESENENEVEMDGDTTMRD